MSKRPPAPTIVFDLDGTLVDTVEDIAAAFDLAIEAYGRPPTSRAIASSLMGEGLSGFFWRGLVAHRLNLPAEEAAAVYRQFLVAYRKTPVAGSRTYPGIEELVEDVREAGAHTAVCTNKVEDIAMEILIRLGLRPLFDAVVGHYGDRPKKPDPLTVLEAIARAGGSRTNALMIGDTSADSGAAVAAGIPAILVSYGYSHFAIHAVRTNVHVDSVAELRTEVMRFVAPGERRAQSWAYR